MLPFENRVKPKDVSSSNYELLRSQMIDDFRHCPAEDLERFVEQPPPLFACNDYHRAHLAATVEHLCLERCIPVPAWCSYPPYNLAKPRFPAMFTGFKPLEDYTLEHLDEVFEKHGILVSDDVNRRA